MELADLLVVTGSQNNVRAGYSSGTPAIGVGQGNVVSIIDETADIKDATTKIAASKVFDNATSCSSENAVVAVGSVYDEVVVGLEAAGGLLLTPEEVRRLEDVHWHDGHMTTTLLAKDIDVIIDALDLKSRACANTQFLIAPTDQAGPDALISGEKMSRFLALYRAEDFDAAVDLAKTIQDYQGAGHSLSLHSALDERARHLAMSARTCRVIVNQAHCFANGGFFNNGLPFSLSMGCGSWGGNSIDDNLHWRHFINRVRVVRQIKENKPELEEIFGNYWNTFGK
jgi:sulfoacetaldehyde dehydrogenase